MKKSIRTKLISLALASCLSVSLMACNKSDSDDETTAAEGTTAAEATGEETFASEALASDAETEAEIVEEIPVDDGFDPEGYLTTFYNALYIDHDFDVIYNATVPPEMHDEIERSEALEFDVYPENFDLYEYMKSQYSYYEFDGSTDYWYEIVSCEPMAVAPEEADSGSTAYAAVVTWGCTEADGEAYEETEDDLIIFRLNGNWYLSGNYW